MALISRGPLPPDDPIYQEGLSVLSGNGLLLSTVGTLDHRKRKPPANVDREQQASDEGTDSEHDID